MFMPTFPLFLIFVSNNQQGRFCSAFSNYIAINFSLQLKYWCFIVVTYLDQLCNFYLSYLNIFQPFNLIMFMPMTMSILS